MVSETSKSNPSLLGGWLALLWCKHMFQLDVFAHVSLFDKKIRSINTAAHLHVLSNLEWKDSLQSFITFKTVYLNLLIISRQKRPWLKAHKQCEAIHNQQKSVFDLNLSCALSKRGIIAQWRPVRSLWIKCNYWSPAVNGNQRASRLLIADPIKRSRQGNLWCGPHWHFLSRSLARTVFTWLGRSGRSPTEIWILHTQRRLFTVE